MGNVGISRSERDFQVPVETVPVVSIGTSFPQPSSPSHDVIEAEIQGGCSALAGLSIIVPSALLPQSLFIDRPVRVVHGAGLDLLRGLLCAQVGVDFGAPASGSTLEDVRVMEQPIEQRGDRGGVAEQLAPVVDRAV